MKRLLRVRRLVEYVGEPEAVLAQLARSMKEGAHDMPLGDPRYRVTISPDDRRATAMGVFA